MTDRSASRAAGHIVDEHGTGLLVTTVTALPGGLHRWHRRPGPACPAPFHPLTAPSRAVVPHTAASCGARAATGEAAPDGSREYTAPGPYSLAHVLMAGGGPHAAPGGLQAVEHIVHGTGALLASLHRQPVTPEARRPSRGITRLHAWLSGATAAGGADAVSLLGPDAVAPLTAWAAEAVTQADTHVLSHGAPGLGSLVPSPAGDRAVLLTGEDICAAPRHLDVGWLTGELVELRWLLGRVADPGAWQALVDAFLDGYGGGAASGGDHGRGAALRVALHAHDSAAYVAQGKGPAALYGVLAARLTEEAAS